MKVLTGISLLVIGILIGLFFQNFNFTGRTIENKEYTWTTAICNDDRKCIDVEIHCNNGEVVSIVPASNLKEFDVNWSDPRVNSTVYCS